MSGSRTSTSMAFSSSCRWREFRSEWASWWVISDVGKRPVPGFLPVPQLRRHPFEPARVSGGFDPHPHRPGQARVERSCFSALVFQATLHQFARLRIQHRNLLVAKSPRLFTLLVNGRKQRADLCIFLLYRVLNREDTLVAIVRQ